MEGLNNQETFESFKNRINDLVEEIEDIIKSLS